jgi:inhibitor of KinA sporulation pathway (predicted exonuclease)
MSVYKKHISWDVETFGVRNYAMIISIGAVFFDPQTPGKIYNKFYVAIDPKSEEDVGFRVDVDTVMWWMKPEQRPAYDAWLAQPKVDSLNAFEGLTSWLDSLDEAYTDPSFGAAGPPEGHDPAKHRVFWGNSPRFDNLLIDQHYEVLRKTNPWLRNPASHWNDADLRTLRLFNHAKAIQPPREGTHHNALDDAIHQARWIQQIVKRYGIDLHSVFGDDEFNSAIDEKIALAQTMLAEQEKTDAAQG